jgi:solute carrier family 8 (sodium/calcium exchanger)
MSNGFLGVVYLVFLGYLFLGIAIIADIFMEAIEVITSKTSQVDVFDSGNKKIGTIDVPVWNPTIANLTLMALGSSAPEILLSVIEALGNLGETAGELGPSTIVGSAAFNLLCISAVSIVSVDEPKYIFDRGVFFTTAIFSIFAYVWVLVVLSMWTPNSF